MGETGKGVSESQGLKVPGFKVQGSQSVQVKHLAFNVVNASLYETCTTCMTCMTCKTSFNVGSFYVVRKFYEGGVFCMENLLNFIID